MLIVNHKGRDVGGALAATTAKIAAKAPPTQKKVLFIL